MSEKDNGQNLDERMAACPVYRKVKVESVLDELEMGEDLRPLFHELVYLRGEWPETMDEAQMWEFANRANDLVIDLVNGDSLSKELLFINELRVALGWTKRRMDLSEIKKAGMLYTGLATEHYYAASIV